MLHFIINKLRYLIKNKNIFHCQIMTDDGTENGGIAKTTAINIQHIVAQKDVHFSNSMIEAANKQLKYRFLYHKTITSFDDLKIYMQSAVQDYNNRPYHALGGQTPLEVLAGSTTNYKILKADSINARTARKQYNRQQCYIA